MRWRGGRRSTNIEDRRGFRMGRRGGIGLAGGGIGGIVLLLIALFLGVDPSILLQGGGGGGGGYVEDPAGPGAGAPPVEGQGELPEFVSVVLADTEDTWSALFEEMGGTYREPALVLFSEAVQSACGLAPAAVGPFYCPADSKIYIDLSFYRDLEQRFQAPGDFAQAYVIAHEVGHHVQNLMGISEEVSQLRARLSPEEANQLSVMTELQADCFAGLWAHHADRSRQLLETGDIEEGLNAASAIGDDRMQARSRGTVDPDSFTHGSAEQRVRWFRRGLQEGDVASCDTFNVESAEQL